MRCSCRKIARIAFPTKLRLLWIMFIQILMTYVNTSKCTCVCPSLLRRVPRSYCNERFQKQLQRQITLNLFSFIFPFNNSDSTVISLQLTSFIQLLANAKKHIPPSHIFRFSDLLRIIIPILYFGSSKFKLQTYVLSIKYFSLFKLFSVSSTDPESQRVIKPL